MRRIATNTSRLLTAAQSPEAMFTADVAITVA